MADVRTSHQRAIRTTAATLTARATDAPPSTTAAKAMRPIASHHRDVRTLAPAARGRHSSTASQMATLPPEIATT